MGWLWLLAAGFHAGVRNQVWVSFVGRIHADVNVFEDVARGDAENAVGRLDQVVALAAGVLAPQRISEGEAASELLCVNEKSGAIGLPLGVFHGLVEFQFQMLLAHRSRQLGGAPSPLVVFRGRDCSGTLWERRRLYERKGARSIQYFWCN